MSGQLCVTLRSRDGMIVRRLDRRWATPLNGCPPAGFVKWAEARHEDLTQLAGWQSNLMRTACPTNRVWTVAAEGTVPISKALFAPSRTVAQRPAEGYDEGPGAPNSPLIRCVGRFWLVSG